MNTVTKEEHTRHIMSYTELR